jgi:thiol-disulfide isomerase/thioredoxin
MHRSLRLPLLALTPLIPLALTSCASAPPAAAEGHGTISDLSAATSPDAPRCQHRVPREACAKCNPSLVPKFKAARDWCAQHDVPESQCFACHPDLTFDPLPPPPEGSDVVELSKAGEDVAALEPHAPPGKVTLFDFYATWCTPCRKIDAHLKELLARRKDLAVRKLNVVSWETPLAQHYLKDAPNLPLVVVYGHDGRRLDAISGLDLGALDRAIEKAGRP